VTVHAYILCWNEELILPYTLNHYSEFCDMIFLLDNMSDDRSLEIAKLYPKVTVKRWDSGGEIRDDLYVQIKSNVYKQSRGLADWVIVCDADEFLVGYQQLESLKMQGVSTPRVIGYQMASRFFPYYREDSPLLTNIIKTGFRDKVFDKQIIFDPTLDLSFGIGAHQFRVNDGRNVCSDSNLRLLHYKYLGSRYLHHKNVRAKSRLSKFNQGSGAGIHYTASEDDARNNVKGCLEVSEPIGFI